MRWFAMLVDGERRGPLPMVKMDGEAEKVALFDSEDAAEEAASQNPLGEAYGYEVYEWPWDKEGL